MQAECALLASDYEGCPLAVVEAMAASVPVAATASGGTGELVRPGATGALAAKGDAEGLADALVRFWPTRPGPPSSARRAAATPSGTFPSTGWSGAWWPSTTSVARTRD